MPEHGPELKKDSSPSTLGAQHTPGGETENNKARGASDSSR